MSETVACTFWYEGSSYGLACYTQCAPVQRQDDECVNCVCSTSRGIRLLNVIGELYGSVMSERVRAGTECAIGEKQCGIRQGRACKEQVQVCGKFLANGKYVFWVFMDLEKAYDTIYQHDICQMLRVYRVGWKMLNAVNSFYVDSLACVRVRMVVSEWFQVNVWLRHGCVMSPWLLNCI